MSETEAFSTTPASTDPRSSREYLPSYSPELPPAECMRPAVGCAARQSSFRNDRGLLQRAIRALSRARWQAAPRLLEL